MPTAVVLVLCLLAGALVGSIVLGVVILKFRSPVMPIGPVERPIVQDNRKPQENLPPPPDQQSQQQQQQDEQAQRDHAARERQVREQRAIEEQNRLRAEQEQARAAEAARQRLQPPRVEPQRVPPQPPTPPRSAITLPPPTPPPPAWTGPDSGQFDYSGPPVPQNGEVIFEPLPPGRVLLNYDQGKWSATLEPLGNGTQRLVMRSLKAGNQKKLRVRWAR